MDQVIPLADPHPRSKVDALARTPFTRSPYLVAYTRLVADVRDVFALLDRFDIGLAHAHARNRPATLAVWRQALLEAWPQHYRPAHSWRSPFCRVRASSARFCQSPNTCRCWGCWCPSQSRRASRIASAREMPRCRQWASSWPRSRSGKSTMVRILITPSDNDSVKRCVLASFC